MALGDPATQRNPVVPAPPRLQLHSSLTGLLGYTANSPGMVSPQNLCTACSLHLESSSLRCPCGSTPFTPLLKHHLLREAFPDHPILMD